MTSLDVRDMLDLPNSAGPRPAKKQKLTSARPNLKGLQREVQSLGGDNPISIVPAVPQFKKRRLVSRKPAAKWELKPFKNSAREDDLLLKHWRRKVEVAPKQEAQEGEGGESAKNEVKEEVDDSAFAKFNVQVNIPKYDDEQYESKLKNEDWTKEETDYLMQTARDFDLRWPLVWDRYEYQPTPPPETEGADSTALVPEIKPRTLEDLKARYYDVAAKMMAVHRPVQFMSQVEFSLHQLMSSFNPGQEALRKRFAENAMSRSSEERREEESLLIELKRIMARSERLNEERKELYSRLDAPPSSSNVGVYTTSAGLQQLVQQLMNADKSKKRKSILGPEGTPTAGPGAAPVDRRDSTVREPAAATPATAKKGAAGPAERRKLSEEDQVVFGVSTHDRLQSGPQFRYDRIAKMISNRSAVLAGRITNVLTELEIPPRLVMPTHEVAKTFELLLGSINVLLDTRKASDKLDAEIKLAEAQKAEREKKEGKKKEEEAGEQAEAAGKEGEAEAESEVKTEGAEKERSVSVARAGSVQAQQAAHKRSASVLSQVSDKSTKRQKK